MQGNDSGNDQSVVQWRAHVARAYESNAPRIAEALSRSYGAALADDAVQETFMRALAWRSNGIQVGRVMSLSFMTRCASRLALRHIRTERRRSRREREPGTSMVVACQAEWTPSSEAERRERCEIAEQTLRELPSWQRPAVHMMVVDRRRCQDVARITGIRSTTLNNWRQRFKVMLRYRMDLRD